MVKNRTRLFKVYLVEDDSTGELNIEFDLNPAITNSTLANAAEKLKTHINNKILT